MFGIFTKLISSFYFLITLHGFSFVTQTVSVTRPSYSVVRNSPGYQVIGLIQARGSQLPGNMFSTGEIVGTVVHFASLILISLVSYVSCPEMKLKIGSHVRISSYSSPFIGLPSTPWQSTRGHSLPKLQIGILSTMPGKVTGISSFGGHMKNMVCVCSLDQVLCTDAHLRSRCSFWPEQPLHQFEHCIENNLWPQIQCQEVTVLFRLSTYERHLQHA